MLQSMGLQSWTQMSNLTEQMCIIYVDQTKNNLNIQENSSLNFGKTIIKYFYLLNYGFK